jgi:hypothetical protein
MTRGNAAPIQLQLGPEIGSVELQFEVAPEPATGYRLRMVVAGEKELWVREGSGWPAPVLRILADAAKLPPGPARLELLAIDAAGLANPVGFYDILILAPK